MPQMLRISASATQKQSHSNGHIYIYIYVHTCAHFMLLNHLYHISVLREGGFWNHSLQRISSKSHSTYIVGNVWHGCSPTLFMNARGNNYATNAKNVCFGSIKTIRFEWTYIYIYIYIYMYMQTCAHSMLVNHLYHISIYLYIYNI